MRPTSVRLTLAGSLVACLALAGCTGHGSASEAPSLADRIAQPDTGPGAEELVELAATEFADRTLDALATAGTLAFATSTTTTGGQAPGTTRLQGALRLDGSRVDLYSTGSGPGAADLVLIDDVLYMREGPGGTWLQLDLGAGEESMYGFAARAHDPLALLGAMREPKEFAFSGTHDVDGIATNRYRVVVSARAYLRSLRMPASMASTLPAAITTDVWVDADDRIRRFEQEVVVPAGQGRGRTTTRTEVSYSDYGLPVEIVAPDATDVTGQLRGGT